jgi:hypothetical protein
MLAARRMEDGPEDPANYTSSRKYTDMTFFEEDQLYWEDYMQGEGYFWEFYLDYDYYNFTRFTDVFPSNPLFDSQGPHFNDIE